MTSDYRATDRDWDWVEATGNHEVPAYPSCIRELRARVEALEAQQQIRSFPAGLSATTVAPTTGLHSYKIGEAEPIEDWGKGHTLVNPEPSLKEQALEALQFVDEKLKGHLPLHNHCNAIHTISRALEQLP